MIAIYCGIYNMEVKCMETTAQSLEEEKWVYTMVSSYTIPEVIEYHLKLGCDNLRMYIINPKEITYTYIYT